MTFSEAYTWWNSAIADRYFRAEEAGRPAYLAVDEDELSEIAAEAGRSAIDAIEDFSGAARESLSRAPNLFRPWIRQLPTWRADGEIPPYIALLALCVVAASRMQADPEERIAANDYYSRLNPLLGRLPHSGMPPGFDEVRRLWSDLDAWLDHDLRGSRGSSPVTTPVFFVNIGYPLSQCALRVGDRHRLTDFFRSARLEPGDQVSDSRLLVLLKAWAVRPSSGLSNIGRRAIVHAEAGGLRANAIVAIAQRELSQWDGQLRDVRGRRRAECVVILTMRRGRVTGAKVFAPRPEGFPDTATWDSAEGPKQIRSATAGWYSQVPCRSIADLFRHGIALSHGRYAITWQPVPLVVFGKTFVPESGWMTVRQATPREEHVVAAARSLRHAIVPFLGQYAATGWKRAEGISELPPDWDLYTGVRIIETAQGDIPSGLDALVPRLNTATQVEGGLRLSPGVYLMGGEPDLHISVGEGEMAELTIDTLTEALSPGTLTLNLSEHRLHEGPHEIRAGERTIRFSTTRTFGHVEPDHAGELAHVIEKHGSYQPRSIFASDGASGPAKPGSVEVCGADIDAAPADLPVNPRPPAVLPHGFLKYEIIGPTPGELQTVTEPAKPTWLEDWVDDFQFFEVEPDFDDAVLILTGHKLDGRGRTAIRVLGDRPKPPSAAGQPDEPGVQTDFQPPSGIERARAWAHAILTAAPGAEIDSTLSDVWREYVDAATRVLQPSAAA